MKKRKKTNQKTKKQVKWNYFAIFGFILAFLSWFSILGIAFSIIGIIETRKRKQKGRILAIAGLIIGIIDLVWKAYY